jgi:hypothetical protein
MILTGGNRITRTVCSNATCYTTNLTWTDLGSNLGFYGRRATTNRLINGLKYSQFTLKRFRSYRAVNKLRLRSKTQPMPIIADGSEINTE